MTRATLVGLFATTSAAVALLVTACDESGLSVTPLPDGGGAASDGGSTSDGSTSSDGSTTKDSATDAPGDGGTTIDFGTCGDAAGNSTCNPVNGSGCDLPGNQTCDYNPPGSNFKCYPNGTAATNVDVCQACSPTNNIFCKPGLTCSPDGICVRYCCANADCKGHGNCALPGPFDLPGIGICFDEVDQLCNDAGAGDGASDAPTDAPDAG